MFEAVGYPEESKVSSTTYYLQDEADTWWSEKSKDVASIPDFTWDKFVDLVRDKFYPPYLQKEMAEEFAKLRMGTITVNEYYAKFIEWSRFAKESVSTEKLKARRFESGLTIDLQLRLCGQVFETLMKVMAGLRICTSWRRG